MTSTSLFTHIPTCVRDCVGRIDAKISDDLEKRLRLRAVEVYGGKKGSLTEALEDAIRLWLREGNDGGGRKK